MKQTVRIHCQNNGRTVDLPMGSNLREAYELLQVEMEHEPVIAHVNNKVEGMHYRLYKSKTIEFLDITSASGERTYTRTLFFVLSKAVHDLYAP